MTFRTSLLLAPVIIALLVSCGKKDDKTKPDPKKDQANKAKGEHTDDDGHDHGAAESIAGAWTIDIAEFKKMMFESAKAAGEIPAEATMNDPMVEAMFAMFDEVKVNLQIKDDGTWSQEITGGPAAESASGTWKKTDAGFEFTRTKKNGVEETPEVATATVEDDTMTLTVPDGTRLVYNRV